MHPNIGIVYMKINGHKLKVINIFKNTRKLHTESHFLMGLLWNFGLMGQILTKFWNPALWKCFYGPWDHFEFSVKSWL